jgi:hypothetical protein
MATVCSYLIQSHAAVAKIGDRSQSPLAPDRRCLFELDMVIGSLASIKSGNLDFSFWADYDSADNDRSLKQGVPLPCIETELYR